MYSYRFFISVLFVAVVCFQTQAQTTTSEGMRAEKAKADLSKKGIPEDQVKAALLKKGIDLDNLKPEQLATLEEDIRAVVSELENAKNSEAGSAVNDITTSLENGMDSLIQKQAMEQAGDNAEGVIEDIEDGASLQEALANDLTEKLSKQYTVKTNIFGHHIFYDKSIDLFRTTSSSTTPESYLLDVGDKIAINIFGASQADLLYEIEEDGFIRPMGMYKVYLKGISIGKAKVLLRNRFRQGFTFSDGQFNVVLHTARTININLFGEVNQPGSYTISALNTAINAIIAAGGITSKAGIREIRIIRDGKEQVLDIYDFVARPSTMYDYYLRDNDIIFVPQWEKLVSASGPGFKTPGKFEMLEDENFTDLLSFTQGLSSRAFTDRIQYTTTVGEEQVFRNYSLQEIKDNVQKLKDGDAFLITTSTVAAENFVEVKGAVRHQGKYEFKEGQKVADILTLAHLEEETYAKLAYITRKNEDGTYKLIRLHASELLKNPESSHNVLLEKEDVITLYSKASFVDNYQFEITGAVRSPKSYFYDPEENITVYDAIMLSKGLKVNATEFGYIVGAPIENSLENNYTVINLKEIMQNPSSEDNLYIKPQDRIVIPSKEEYSEKFTVSIEGAVRRPGSYTFDSTLSVKDMVVMAGGLKLEAASNKVDVFRLSIDQNSPTRTYATSIILDHNLDPFNQSDTLVLKPYDKIVVRSTPEFEPMQLVQLNGEVRYPGIYAILGENETVSSLVERAGGFTNEALPEASTFIRTQDNIGRIVTRLDKAIKCKDQHDIRIKDGDNITIPKIVDIVTLDKTGTRIEDKTLVNDYTGEVLKLAVNYKSRRAGWYVRKYAGGFDRSAARRKTIVAHPNGEIKRTINLLGIKIYPKVRRDSKIELQLKRKRQRELEKLNNEEKGIIQEEPKKERLSMAERLTSLQAVIAIASSTTTTAISTLLLIRELNKEE